MRHTPPENMTQVDFDTLDTITSLANLLAIAITRLPHDEWMPSLPAELRRLNDMAYAELQRRPRAHDQDGAA